MLCDRSIDSGCVCDEAAFPFPLNLLHVSCDFLVRLQALLHGTNVRASLSWRNEDLHHLPLQPDRQEGVVLSDEDRSLPLRHEWPGIPDGASTSSVQAFLRMSGCRYASIFHSHLFLTGSGVLHHGADSQLE